MKMGILLRASALTVLASALLVAAAGCIVINPASPEVYVTFVPGEEQPPGEDMGEGAASLSTEAPPQSAQVQPTADTGGEASGGGPGYSLTSSDSSQCFQSQTVCVAVLDSGVDETSRLRGKLVGGINIASGGSDYEDLRPGGNTHGTWVAETIVALAPNAYIMPVKVPQKGNWDDGIYWALNHGADVINMSIEYAGSCSSDLQAAVDAAYGSGVPIFGSPGGSWQSGAVQPASCNHVLAVGGSDQGGLSYNDDMDVTYIVDDASSPSYAVAYVSGYAASLIYQYPSISGDWNEINDAMECTIMESAGQINLVHMAGLSWKCYGDECTAAWCP